jgi:ribonucleoside-diphosphate reductase alpha chain
MKTAPFKNPRSKTTATPANGLNEGDTPRSTSKRPGNGGMEFGLQFSRPGVHPFDTVEWERRTAEITDDSGKVIFKQENIEVPQSWSVLATKIAVSKYFYGDIANGTDPSAGGRETSVKQLVHRVTRTITDWGIKDGYFKTKVDAENFYSDLTWLSVNQHGAFNSPVWFNVGLYHQYGVGKSSGAGNYYYNPTTGKAERARTQYEYPQGSACFIQSVDDNMEDIMRLATSEAMLFKFGSGTAQRPDVIFEGLRSNRQCSEVGRQNPAGGQDEHAQRLASRHRGIHQREGDRGEEGVGPDRTGLRWQL